MGIFQLEDGRKIEVEGEVTPEKVSSIMGELGSDNSKEPSMENQLSQGSSELEKTMSKGDTTIIGDVASEVGTGLARGVVQGGQGMIETAVNAYELGAKVLGAKASAEPRKFLQDSKYGLDHLPELGIPLDLKPAETITGKIAEGIGQFPAFEATFGNPLAKAIGTVKLAAAIGAINAQQDGILEMAKQGTISAGQLRVLGAAQKIGGFKGALLGAATMGAPTAIQGQGKDAIAQATIGSIFPLFEKGAAKNLKDVFDGASNLAGNARERANLLIHSMEQDPVAYQQQKLLDREKRLQSVSASIEPAFNEVLEREQMRIGATQDAIEMLDAEARITGLDAKRASEDRVSKQVSDAEDIFRLKKEEMTDEMMTKSVKDARDLQSKMYAFQQQASPQYGKGFDAAMHRVDQSSPVSRDFAASAVGELYAQGIQHGRNPADPVMKKLEAEIQHYGVDPISDFFKKVPFLDNAQQRQKLDAGQFQDKNLQQEYNQAKLKSDEPIPFKEFFQRSKKIWTAHEGDYIAHDLKSSVGEFIAKVDPTFAQLQGEYRDFASFRNKLYDIWKPGKGKAYVEGGASFLQKVGEGGFIDPEVKHFLEKGTTGKFLGKEFSHLQIEGLGPVTERYQALSDKFSALEQHFNKFKDTEWGIAGQQLTEIARKHTDEIIALDKSKKINKSLFEQINSKLEKEVTEKANAIKADLYESGKKLEKRKEDFAKKATSIKRIEGMKEAIINVARATGQPHLAWGMRAASAARKAMKATAKMGKKISLKR